MNYPIESIFFVFSLIVCACIFSAATYGFANSRGAKNKLWRINYIICICTATLMAITIIRERIPECANPAVSQPITQNHITIKTLGNFNSNFHFIATLDGKEFL